MKPSINTSLIVLAQELNERVSVLVEDEYEKSRLGAWAGMLFIASMKIDDLADGLFNENKEILSFLTKYKSELTADLAQRINDIESSGPTDIKIAREALKITGTRDLENRPFASLSGGEKQRVIIASALAQLLQTSTKYEFGITEGLLLLDEPTAALDLRYQLEIAATLRSLNKNQNTTIVVATHDLNLAASLCDQLILLRSGHVLKEGPTLKVLSAETVRTLYNVEADVRFDENSGYLNITPISKSPNA